MQKQSAPQAYPAGLSLSKKPRRVSRPMGAKGTAIIFGGGVYVAENTFRGAQCRIVRLWRTTEARSAAPVPIGRLWNPRSAFCTSWERRSSEMTELSALAVSEGYAACDDDGGLYCQKRPSRAFFDSLTRGLSPPRSGSRRGCYVVRVYVLSGANIAQRDAYLLAVLVDAAALGHV